MAGCALPTRVALHLSILPLTAGASYIFSWSECIFGYSWNRSATLNSSSANDSFAVIENSGNALTTVNLQGSGELGIMSALPNAISTINGVTASANLTITLGTTGSTTNTGSGNDQITITGGGNTVTTSSWPDNNRIEAQITLILVVTDTITISGGTNTVVTEITTTL